MERNHRITNSEIQAIFEQDLITLTNADIPMGLQEAILADVKNQGLEEGLEIGLAKGIEQGIEIGEANLLSLTVPTLYQKGLSVEEIAMIYQVSIAKIEEILANWQNEQQEETNLEEE